MIAIGVDIGGTFTDICLLRQDQVPRLHWTKEPSTPDNPIRAVLNGTKRILEIAEVEASQVDLFLHGTTVATNAVLENRGARIGIVMTAGFEHTLSLGRGHRYDDLYSLEPRVQTPIFLAPGRCCLGVEERVAADGSLVTVLDEAALLRGVERLVNQEGVEALAVCYLFSFVNPHHELRTRELIRQQFPAVELSLSHEVDPVFREYERACLTAFDAYLRPVMGKYLMNLEDGLRSIGIRSQVLTMQSRGGLASTSMSIDRPVTTLLSGPAAGVVGAERISREAGYRNCITLDMGGTSTEVALIAEGRSLSTTTGRIDRYPLRIPMVDVNTIGAGGGSIAWLDGAHSLRVGPQSAGASPGPACYARGGDEPTVTDASVVLGYLSPEYFAGNISVDPAAASAAIAKISAPLGLSIPETALAIHQIVNARMADAIRLVSVKRGYDARDFTLVLFGGGGPVNGWAVASELSIRRTMVPFAPGALCAYGLLSAPLEYYSAQTLLVSLDDVRPVDLEREFTKLDQFALERLARDGIGKDSVHCRRSADMRYVGQSYELEVPIADSLDDQAFTDARSAFHDLHSRVYGHAQKDARIELVNLRTVHSHHYGLDPVYIAPNARTDKLAPLAFRDCYFDNGAGFVETAIFHRDQLIEGDQVDGPAIIHQSDSTLVIGPRFNARVDSRGNVIMELRD